MRGMLKMVVGSLALVAFGIVCSALFVAIRVEDAEYLMIGFPLFLVAGSVHFLVAKRWAPLIVTFIIGSLVGYFFPFLFG